MNDQREINFCFGTSTAYGIVTDRSCCEVDELFVVDKTKSEEVSVDFNSIWIDNHICLINKTENLDKDIKNINDTKDCAIQIFDSYSNDFIKIEFDDRNITYLNENWYYSTTVTNNFILLNGTAIICQQNTIFGILTKSKSHKWKQLEKKTVNSLES